MRRPRLVLLASIMLPLSTFAQVPGNIPEEKIACLRTELVRAGLPATVSDELLTGRLANLEQVVASALGENGLQSVAKTCFPEATSTASRGTLGGSPGPEHPSEAPPSDIPPEVSSCLKTNVGEQAFAEISSGQRGPTPEEMAKGKACFPDGPPGGGHTPPGDIPPEQRTCVVGILGEQVVNDMRQGRIRPETISPDLMRRVGRECFKDAGGLPPGGNPDVVVCFQALEQQKGSPAFVNGPPSGEFYQGIEDCLRKDPNYQGPPTFDRPGPEACIEQCAQFEGGKFNREQCAQMCSGQPPADGGYPMPETGSPAPSYTPFLGGGTYPSSYPYPGQGTSGFPEAGGQNCTVTCTERNGAQQCQTQCSGGSVQGAATERDTQWLTRFLLNLIRF